MRIVLLFLLIVFFESTILAQHIPADQLISIEELPKYLKPETKQELAGDNQKVSEKELAEYFRSEFSKHFFYNWHNNDVRFEKYSEEYDLAEFHVERALDHQNKFDATTLWKLPFIYKNGDAVDAYALRHLARQHKMVDIALQYYYRDRDNNQVAYFKNQLKSLNAALAQNEYETLESGNGVYEVFRSGYRILNWLQIHNLFLNSDAYTDQDQLITIATLLQHASNLYKSNTEFQSGNHQTRGMSALAMLAILFKDFKDADIWYERAMSLLEGHLEKEINSDGFQFERSVHYHISDIENYFYVYQLAQNSQVNLSPTFENKLKSLFTTLIKIAYPDKSAPVFSDDTDAPWAESNDIKETLTLGYLLFDDPEMGYFAGNSVSAKLYWFLKDEQLDRLNNINRSKPSYKSLALEKTGYYIMREGWDKNDAMLVISAGLDPDKPDHQHGDMLGIQAYANGDVLLPNYQVRYSLKDLELFKNSEVKNVALVDDVLQGKDYKSNKGGSGFGKFGSLPNPKTIAFSTDDHLDLYIGSHNGFEEMGVTYSRQVFFIDHKFWIVKDNFNSEKIHNYKQVWQGHYTLEEAPQLLRSTFRFGSGLDIYQLQKVDTVSLAGKRGKEWAMPQINSTTNFSFITALVPFKTYQERVDESALHPKIKDWEFSSIANNQFDQNTVELKKKNEAYFFNAGNLTLKNVNLLFEEPADVYIREVENQIYIKSLSERNIQFNFKILKNNQDVRIQVLKPGEAYQIDLKN